MTKTVSIRKRFLWHPSDLDAYYSDDCEERKYMYGRPRPTPMASLLNLELREYELIRFYNNESTPLLVATTGKDTEAQGLWMANVTKLNTSNKALKEICMAFATMHMGHNRKSARYVLKNGQEHPKSAGPPKDMRQVAGYTRLDDEVLQQMFIQLTSAAKAHQRQIQTMTLASYEAVLLSSVLIYLHAMSMGPYVPLFNFDGGADLFSLGRTIRDLSLVYSDKMEGRSPYYYNIDIDLGEKRAKLPREEDLWAIIDFVDTDEDLSRLEKRRIKRALTTELKNLIYLFHLDREAVSVSHIAAWCTFWTPNFYSLLREEANTYALLFVCYWCGYAHMWHVLFWWGDRILDDLLYLKDHLPERVHHFLEWPLQCCTRYDVSYIDLLSGKLRNLYF
ncbi:hypothetical protein CJU89_1373 [Yarrowia sp. B02]|nr:hypothetical protein CJU89_1373 [Yarrowia sp. B02]